MLKGPENLEDEFNFSTTTTATTTNFSVVCLFGVFFYKLLNLTIMKL